MNKIKLILLLCLSIGYRTNTYACSVCGCSQTFGLSGQGFYVNNSLLGLNYSYVEYNSQHPYSLNPALNGRKSNEQFHQWTVTSRFFFKKVAIQIEVPYKLMYQNTGNSISKNGLGDAKIYGGYMIKFQPDSICKPWMHYLFPMIGVKLPTGNSSSVITDGDLNYNLQMGSGTFAFPIKLTYFGNNENGYSIMVDAMYLYQLPNSANYLFANRYIASITGGKAFRVGYQKKINFNLGFYGEYAGQDKDKAFYQNMTGTKILGLNTSVGFSNAKFSIGISSIIPIYQNISDGYVKNHFQLQLFINRKLNFKKNESN